MAPKKSQSTAAKRKEAPAPKHVQNHPSNMVAELALSSAMLASAAVASRLSQTLLAPEYGSIPISVNHDTAMLLSPALGFLLFTIRPAKTTRLQLLLTVWIAYLPSIHWLLSSALNGAGPVAGPIVLGASTCHSVVLASSYVAASATVGFKRFFPRPWGAAVYGLVVAASVALVSQFDRQLTAIVPKTILAWNDGIPPIGQFDPVKAYLVFAACHGLVLLARRRQAPRWMWWLAVPAFLSLPLNPHLISPLNTSLLNRSLRPSEWALLDRQWSNTGYVSVLENLSEGYRVLRCDHSLLGGEWLVNQHRRDNEGWTVNEPIYHVFEMLEAVRLIESKPIVADSAAKALVVGLGIGTAPKALIGHGINTTIVELDPTVHAFATKYFGLPENHTAIIQDAVSWVESAKQQSLKYDYILHDVFTGGAEPLALFTHDFIQGLRHLLQPHGIVAINYAGDLGFPLTQKVLHTVDTVFDGQCRAFGDAAPSSEGQNFMNMVLFCRNLPDPIHFRKPTKADFLGSISRKHYLLPNLDHEIAFPRGVEASSIAVLTKEEIPQWRPQQIDSALRHWKIMREVLPDIVWQLW